MVDDLKIIKKYYGEKMSHLCRELFPTLLETPGLLSDLMLKTFEPSKLLYEDLIYDNLQFQFQNFMFSLTGIEDKDEPVTKTPAELLDEAGYILYECHSEADIQKFKKYYARGEELCTFSGGRLNRCHVFFAVKKDVDKIKREDFKNPRRQDLYGTSVISIQFSRGNNSLSIKNRYNHAVSNPDATFSNNLDNIILGLTDSFEVTYGLELGNNKSGFEIPGYVRVNGKYYKYNYERDNIYYCTNNLIIDNYEVKRDYQQMERYILFDYFILDLKEKTLKPYTDRVPDETFGDLYMNHSLGQDPFLKTIGKIKDIKVINDKSTGNKIIYIYTRHKEPIEIEVNKANQMIRYKNNNIRKLPRGTLIHNKYLEELQLDKVVLIEKSCLYNNTTIKRLSLKSVYEIGEDFFYFNRSIQNAIFPKFFFIHDGFFGWNQVFDYQKVGVRNRFVKFLRSPSMEYGPIVLVHLLISVITNQTIKLSNRLLNKKDYDFSNDEVTIKSIKKTNAFSHLIDFIISKRKKGKELEEENKKGKSL